MSKANNPNRHNFRLINCAANREDTDSIVGSESEELTEKWEVIRPTLKNQIPDYPLTQEYLNIADSEFKRFGEIAYKNRVHVIPYERLGLEDTGVTYIDDGVNLENIITEYPSHGRELLARMIGVVTNYISDVKDSYSEFILSDLAKPSQYVYDNKNLWLVDIEPRISKVTPEILRSQTRRLLGHSACLLGSSNPNVTATLRALIDWRNKIDT